MSIPKSREKLLKLFNDIQDEPIKNIISLTVLIENENRSSLKFPIKKIEDIVDNEANLIEIMLANEEK